MKSPAHSYTETQLLTNAFVYRKYVYYVNFPPNVNDKHRFPRTLHLNAEAISPNRRHYCPKVLPLFYPGRSLRTKLPRTLLPLHRVFPSSFSLARNATHRMRVFPACEVARPPPLATRTRVNLSI